MSALDASLLRRIPADVIAAARRVSDWFEGNNIKEWELCGCRSRASVLAQPDESKLPPRPAGHNGPDADPDSPLVRYGRASKEGGALLEPMADGYWTPWHIANEMLRATSGVPTVAPTLPQSLLDLIGDYGMARTDGVSDVERLHRWQLLIDGIKAYALGVSASDGETRRTGIPKETTK